jgi:hypothetical protein
MISFFISKLSLNKKGQFFSPDLVIAILIFLVCLTFFFVSSDSVFGQVRNNELMQNGDEVMHSVMNSLVLTSGKPFNWEALTLEETYLMGLCSRKNVIDEAKLEKLIYYLDNNYIETKEILGLGGYDIKLKFVDNNGSTTYSSTRTQGDYYLKLVYDRTAILNDRVGYLRGEITYEK